MSDRKILYLTSWPPMDGGRGTEQRTTNTFLGLSALGRVHVLYFGKADVRSFVERHGASLTYVDQILDAYPKMFRRHKSRTVLDRVFGRAWGASGEVLPLSDQEANAVASFFANDEFAAIFAMNLSNAVWIDSVADRMRIPLDRRLIDWDVLESPTIECVTATDIKPSFVTRRRVKWNVRKLRRFERRILGTWGLHLCSSEVDVPYLARCGRRAVAVPNGYVMPTVQPGPVVKAVTPTAVFIAGFGYWANVDGARHFIDKIWPSVRSRLETARLLVVGHSMPQSLIALSGTNGIEMHRDVPDVAPYYEQAQVVVAPMRHSVGSAIKIIEALGHRRPLVCFGLAGSRHELRSGEHYVSAESDEEFATATIGLLSDYTKAEAIAEAGYRYVRSHLTREAVVARVAAEVGAYLSAIELAPVAHSSRVGERESVPTTQEAIGGYR